MIATKDFRYHDFRSGKSVEVRAGQEVSAEYLRANKVDTARLERTKYLEPVPEPVRDDEPRPKKRVRAKR